MALGDDTAANFMQIRCRAFEASDEGYAMYPGTGYGYWGSYGNWSESCVPGTAVCGIRTRIERPQGGGNADDTTLNDLELYCCGLD